MRQSRVRHRQGLDSRAEYVVRILIRDLRGFVETRNQLGLDSSYHLFKGVFFSVGPQREQATGCDLQESQIRLPAQEEFAASGSRHPMEAILRMQPKVLEESLWLHCRESSTLSADELIVVEVLLGQSLWVERHVFTISRRTELSLLSGR